MRRRFFLLAALATALLSGVATANPILLGTIGSGGTSSTLVQLDPTTGGVIQTIGPVGYVVNGLTYDSVSGRLFGSTGVTDPNYNGLIEINMATGAGTPIGVSGWGLGSSAAVTNITTNSSGQMFGWWDPSQDDLVSIDINTGIATRVGESGVGTAANGLSFDGSDGLYMVNFNGAYYSVDPNTGAATFLGNIGTMAHHGDFDPLSGFYFGISDAFGNPRSIIVADLSTGNVISTLPTVDGLHTLTFVQQANVPEPATVLTLGVGVTFLVGVIRRRGRKEAQPVA